MKAFDYVFTKAWQTQFIVASQNPTYTVNASPGIPYQSLRLKAIRPVAVYLSTGGNSYLPSMSYSIGAILRNPLSDYVLSAPTPGGSQVLTSPSLVIPVDSKLNGQIFEVDALVSQPISMVVALVSQFGAGPGTTIPNGGGAYSIGDILTISVDFFFDVDN